MLPYMKKYNAEVGFLSSLLFLERKDRKLSPFVSRRKLFPKSTIKLDGTLRLHFLLNDTHSCARKRAYTLGIPGQFSNLAMSIVFNRWYRVFWKVAKWMILKKNPKQFKDVYDCRNT
jgi:hypothetical protein